MVPCVPQDFFIFVSATRESSVGFGADGSRDEEVGTMLGLL
jgi:hypothetical protein